MQDRPGVVLRPGLQGLGTDGYTADAMRRANESAVFRAVFRHGPASRAEITRLTGLSAPSVTKLTGRLIAGGMLCELAPEARPALGRPRVPVAVDPDRVGALGVHLGVESGLLALVGLDGSISASEEVHWTAPAPASLVDQLVNAAATFLDTRLGDRRLLGTGVIMGGWVDDAAGVVIEHRPLDWSDVRLLDMLGDRLPGPVHLEEHVRAHARAEMLLGAGRDVNDLVLVHVGNVCDAAIVVDRAIHRGPRGGAGNIDHIRVTDDPAAKCDCGRSGCLRVVATDSAVVARAASAGLIEPGEGFAELVAVARSGVASADELLRRRARHEGRAIATLIDVINPELVVLGRYDPAEYIDDLRSEASAWTQRNGDLADRIVPSSLGAAQPPSSEPLSNRRRVLRVAAAAPVLAEVLDDPLAQADLSA